MHRSGEFFLEHKSAVEPPNSGVSKGIFVGAGEGGEGGEGEGAQTSLK